MKEMKKLLYATVCLLGMTALYSCNEKPEPEPGPTPPAITGQTIMVPNEANAVVEVSMEMESEWEISNSNTWFTVNPLSGAAGPVNFKITVLENNPELTEKVAWFVIRRDADDPGKAYYVVQDVTPGIVLKNTSSSISDSGGEISITFNSNVDVDVESGVDWISVGSIAEDSILLADNSTYSKLKTYTVSVSVSANDGEVREGDILINGTVDESNSLSETFTISQMGELVADYSRDFYRRSFLAKFSATWCGPCYSASDQIHQAMEQVPGRIELAQYMSSSSGGGLAEWDGGDEYYSYLYQNGIIEGYIPAMMWNNYVAWESSNSLVSYLTSLTNESVEELPAHTVIGGLVDCDGSKVNVEIGIASKETAEYKISVFLLEDSLLYAGCAGGSTYPNNDIIREELTSGMWGEPISLSSNTVTEVSYSCDVPSYVEDIDNLHVMVVVYRAGTFVTTTGLPSCDLGYVVDNVVDIPVNGFAIFDYED